MHPDRVLASILLLVGLAVTWQGWRYGYWTSTTGPGTGFFPILVGGLAAILGVWLWIGTRGRGERLWGKGDLRAALLGMAALIGTALLMNYLGMLLALSLFALLWTRLVGRYPWRTGLLVMLCTGGGVYLIFSYWLKVPLPVGLLGI
ncbi:tripartite tricarboxylate transporter TctB family protein [Caldinitratiruptor microaerophilus]|uniref:DUF1468 domain-containing protein n=1 Tax=Caldinitratiruptor microaerophilus TaxID=671077 RepID=A0AA35CMC4_9FIRM|nr:tripartite tricarboxylate transporter TctB family protein [Caldinitratiruptor microaerophilus]BDG61003.1 hypothetical protein caldi_20930 [Caldinitratiruptor microaerophilus]